MKEKIKKYIKSLPTINGLKKQIKALEEEIESLMRQIDGQAGEIVDMKDKDTMITKCKRLELVNKHHWETIKSLREENKRLRDDRKTLN